VFAKSIYTKQSHTADAHALQPVHFYKGYITMSSLLRCAQQAVQQAGDHIRAHFGGYSSVHEKEDASFATNLDLESERLITHCIKQHFPDHSIYGEESGSLPQDSSYTWVIDPLDGTHNFIKRLPLYAVSVGVIYKSEFLCGAIYLPHTNELFSAHKGCGAHKNGLPIKVSSVDSVKHCALAFDSGFKHFDQNHFETLKAIAPCAFNTRVLGSSVTHLALLAEGRIDAIVEFDDYPWDYAAGVCILTEAGGCISALDGSPFCYGSRSYLATNRLLHAPLLQRVALPSPLTASPRQ
jgi:myo-inositol-1(or 4)-monophosphatase